MGLFSSLFEYKPEVEFIRTYSRKLFFLDTETTGTNWNTDRILQFAGSYGNFTRVGHMDLSGCKDFNEYLYVDCDIPDEASKIHGIYKKDIENCKPISEYIDEWIKIIHDCDYIVGYNVEFDLRMLYHECCLIDENKWDIEDFNQILNRKTIDIMKLTAELVNGPGGKWPKLTELYEFLFHGNITGVHDASKDVDITRRCFHELNISYPKIFYPFFAPTYIYHEQNFNKYDFIALLHSGNARYLQYMTDEQMKLYIEWDRKNHKYYNDSSWNLNLPCLRGISNKQAEMLSNYSEIRHYNLSGIDGFSVTQALKLTESMLTNKGKSMNLDGISIISDKEAIRFLEECYPRISLRGLSLLTDKQYEILIEQYGSYDLPNLTWLSDEQVKFLDKIYNQNKFTLYAGNNLRQNKNLIGTKWLQKSKLTCNYFAGGFFYIAPYPKLKE